MKNGKILFPALLLFACLGACIPERVPPVLTEVREPDWATDTTIRRIYSFQDQLLTDSLVSYLAHSDPTYRYAAAMAFASVHDTTALTALISLLGDPIPKVRQAAVFALGQLGSASATKPLTGAFAADDSLGMYTEVNGAVLEALGKCGDLNTLELISTVKTYQVQDTALLLGQARSIYRFALRGITSPLGTNCMVELALGNSFPPAVRTIAANYLARAQNISLDTFAITLAQSAPRIGNINIRMALAQALGKIQRPGVQDTLIGWVGREPDYRVKVNLLKALGNFDYQETRVAAYRALKDGNTNVGRTAAQFFLDNGKASEAGTYWQLARDTTVTWPVSSLLYAAAQRHLPVYDTLARGRLNADLRRRFTEEPNPYAKASYLRALGEYRWNFRFIFRESINASHPAVKTAGMETLAAISSNPDFSQYFGGSWRRVEKELADYFREGIRTRDAGVAAVAAGALRQPNHNYREVLEDITFLDSTLAALKLPQEQETFQEVQQTIANFQGRENAPPGTPAYNHPIDWQIITQLPAKPRAIIQTAKGNITLELFPNHAPGSVANFVALARSKFFDGKVFHRVVPNFVVQGGCPRGDGYGSLDYSIRSELAADFYYDQEGYVGMASAGNHTEGTQFFITHSPTPHLDGRYTIFARVIEGMSVVHRLEIGDRIERITIAK